MALYTITKIGDALLAMLFLDLGLVVATVAGVSPEVAWSSMTGGARNRASAAMIQWEGMVEGCALPGIGVVALCAICPELALVHGWFSVTRDARLWCAFEDVVGVATSAGYVDMRAGQLESGPVVVECGWFPSCCRVALRAVGAECAVVSIILAVAIHTVLRCALECPVDMASSAGHVDMCARQLEGNLIVVERGRLPR